MTDPGSAEAARRSSDEQPEDAGPLGDGAARHRAGRPHSVRGGIWLGVQIVAGLLSLTIVAGVTYGWWNYRQLQSNIQKVTVFGDDGSGADDVDGSDQNILIVGSDSRAGATPEELEELSTEDDGGSNNTDTIMVLHVPADGSTATIISFPRDSWVDVPGFGMNKINAAFALGQQATGTFEGGIELLGQVITNLTGLTMDHFVQVGLLAFLRISNAIGGVQVNLCNAVQDDDSGIDLPAGVQTIQGKDAVSFVRQRHGLPRGDLDRVVRQQVFLSAAFRRIASAGTLLNPLKLKSLIDAVSSSLVIDDKLDLAKFAAQMADLSAGNLRTATIPVAGTPDIIVNGQVVSIVQLDTSAIPQFISQLIGQPTAYTKADTVDPSTVSVTVIDDTTAGGAAEPALDALRAAGFQATTQSSPTVQASTTISYPPGQEAQAKTLAQFVPGAQVAPSGSVTTVTLTLGDDGVTVQTALASDSPSPAPSDSAPSDSAPTDSNPADPTDEPTPTPTPSVSGLRTGDETSCIN